MTAIEMTEKVQGGVIKAIETSQKWTLEAMRSTASAFDTFQPDTSSVPFADQLPSPKEAVDMTFAFMGKLMEDAHSFVAGVTEIYATPAATPAAKAEPAKKA